MDEQEVKWYVMHHNRSSAKKIREKLDRLGIEFFQPQHYVLREVAGRRRKVLEYTLTNYFFVHSSYRELEPLTRPLEPLRLIFNLNVCSGKWNDYLVVPDEQMRNFMLMAAAYDYHPQYLSPQDVDLKRGQRVGYVSSVVRSTATQAPICRFAGGRNAALSCSSTVSLPSPAP